MNCLYHFYSAYPNSREIIYSYSAHVSENLRRIKKEQYHILREKNKRRSPFCHYCVIS